MSLKQWSQFVGVFYIQMATLLTAAEIDENTNSKLLHNVMAAFGCHLQWRELKNIDAITLQREASILEKDTWDFTKRPTYYTAVKNLQGFVAYKLEYEEKAKMFFEDVLNKDPYNINALGNMLCIETENGAEGSARYYENQLKDILERKNYEHRARAYADRAHAIRYFEQDMRCFHYMEHIERASVIGNNCDTPHRAEWFFDHALALYRRDVQMLYLRRMWRENGDHHHNLTELEAKIEAGFVKAVKYFYDVVKISETDDIKALSWVFLGILLNHDDSSMRNFADIFTDGSHELHGVGADMCYQRGLELGQDHAITLRRVGAEYVKLGRYDEAEELLKKSMELVPSWFAYRHTGLRYLALYHLPRSNDNPNKKFLEKAAERFQKALQYKQVHADYSDLGYVYFLLGDFNKAIIQYKLASKSKQDDYFDLVETYRRWAECLGAMGEFEGQRLKEKQANTLKASLAIPKATRDDFFRDEFEFYNAPNRPGFVRIIPEHHIWCTESQRTATELSASFVLPLSTNHASGRVSPVQRYNYDFFISYAERDRRWAFAFLHKLESERNLRGCIDFRDFVAGNDESTNRVNAIKNSFKCITVLTPTYVEPSSEGWNRYELSQAIRESTRRPDYIIPIMLRRCTPPETLRHLTPRECVDGQFAQTHWDELVEILAADHQ